MNATKVKLAYLVCAGALLLASDAMAEEGGKAISKTTISLGTATPGGGFPLYGNAFAEIINAADPALAIEPRNTKGSNENIPLLEEGKLDIALVAGEPSYEAFMGLGGRPKTSLKIFTAMYSSPGMFVVRADSPYKTIKDLVGARIEEARAPVGFRHGRESGPADPSAPQRRRATLEHHLRTVAGRLEKDRLEVALLIGVLAITGVDKRVETWLVDHMPEWLIALTTSV